MTTFTERADQVLAQARELAARVDNWTDYVNGMSNPDDGITASAFPDEAERNAFRETPQYAETQSILLGLIRRFGTVAGVRPNSPAETPGKWEQLEIVRISETQRESPTL